MWSPSGSRKGDLQLKLAAYTTVFLALQRVQMQFCQCCLSSTPPLHESLLREFFVCKILHRFHLNWCDIHIMINYGMSIFSLEGFFYHQAGSLDLRERGCCWELQMFLNCWCLVNSWGFLILFQLTMNGYSRTYKLKSMVRQSQDYFLFTQFT